MERLDKVLAHQGFGTRKDVKRLCRSGVVLINGAVVRDSAVHIDIDTDKLSVDGTEIALQHDLYIMMNKCRDVVCANKDAHNRTVFDLLDDAHRHAFLSGELHCLGRLDIDTEGLLILTTDGQLIHRLLAPKTHVPKTYAVGLRDVPDAARRAEYAELFKTGFWVDHERNIPGFTCQPSKLEWISDCGAVPAVTEHSSGKSDCLLTIYEGKFHQVKRMFSQLGNEVVYLKRIAVGGIVLDSSIKLGGYRELTDSEIEILKS